MAFDPDAYLKSKGFDPDAYLAKKAPTVDMGPNARSAMMLRGMRPSVAPDDVSADDVNPDYTKKNLNRIIAGKRGETIRTPEYRQQLDDLEHRGDPIANDPLAGMIVQSIPAMGLGSLVAGATGVPILGQAATGAAMDPEHPLRGAALNMIPGIPGAVKQADMAIGRAALGAPSLVPAGKAAGAAAGTYLGHRAGGFVGAGVGAGIGTKVGGKLGGLADRGVEALGDRYLARTAQFPRPVTYEPPPVPATAEAPRGPIIEPEIVQTPPAPGAPKQLGPITETPAWDPAESAWEFGDRPPGAPKLYPGAEEAAKRWAHAAENPGVPYGNHGTVGGKTGQVSGVVKPRPSDIGNANTQLAPSSLREDVIRSAKEIREAPPEGPAAPEGTSLEDKLARSVKILDDLKKASANGTLTAEMEQEAVNAGIPPANISRAIGRTSSATSENPIAKARKEQIRRDAKNARILSGRNE